MTPNQIGRYQIRDLLGQGGMGKVYRAYDPDLDREVVLKIVTLPDPASNPEWRERFKREVRAAGRLNHPHIVTVYDVGLEHEPPYVVMELLTGGTLRERLHMGLSSWREALLLLRPLGEALAYAHQAGIIHRDVKPGNIMFSGNDPPTPRPEGGRGGFSATQASLGGGLKLVDFGLARQQSGEALTQTGAVFGTPAYMSPEQARGEAVDARTDIFALGVILFEAVAGYNPLQKESLTATLLATLADSPVDVTPLTYKAPGPVVRLIEQAIAKDRNQRYATGEALLGDLARCLGDERPDETMRTFGVRPISRPPGESSPGTLIIQKAASIQLTPDVETVLRTMFNTASRIAVEAEFGSGLSGGRVFRVRPFRGQKGELPAVVKVAPMGLILKEWEAYQTWVANRLPGVAQLESAPTLPPGSLWDGLRYAMVGGGAFEVQSLGSYVARASAGDLRWVLEERLYPLLGIHWWLERHLDRAFQMQADYDSLLPVNLLLQPTQPPAGVEIELLSPEQLPASPLSTGAYVELQRFIVTEIDPARGQVTLDLPPTPSGLPGAAYRLRLVEVADLDHYQVEQIIDSLTAVVTATRHGLLLAEASRVMEAAVDLSAEHLSPPIAQPGSSSRRFIVPAPFTLPNPLLAYKEMLQIFRPAHISTIHGDLNLENILVDPETRNVNLIDFAAVRQGHSLHDLLRLETEVVTKLIPAALAETNLPASTIHTIYQQLCLATRHPGQPTTLEQLPPALEKPVTMLLAIRKLARTCLFNPDDWTEYDHGLILYLLGALKFKNLDALPGAPLPKQVAFWGAASVVDLLRQPASVRADLSSQPIIRPKSTLSRTWLAVGGAIALGVVILLCLVVGLGPFVTGLVPWLDSGSPPPPGAIARIFDFKPAVMVQRVGTDSQFSADLCMDLYHGDVLQVDPGASVSIACKNMIVQLSDQQQVEVDCPPETTTATVFELQRNLLEEMCASNLGTRVLDFLERSRGAESEVPLLLSPRNSLVADPQPTFRWQPIVGATGYRLSLTPDSGETQVWETSATTLPYPADAPPLAPGSTNIVELTTLDDPTGTAVDQTILQVLDVVSSTELAQAETDIRALLLSETARGFLLAQLYQEYEMWTAAIEQLEPLAETQTPPSAALWQQLGDLYAEIGLYELAESSYQQALAVAEANQDLSAQAAAQVGLARTALTDDQTADQAIEHLTAAETLYRQAGQTDLAEAVRLELVKLQEKIKPIE